MSYIVKRVRNGHTYYYMQESARVDGKPVTVKTTYLGTAEKIEELLACGKNDTDVIPPTYSTPYEFASVSALLDVAERNGIRDIINKHAGKKREQGLSVGDYMVLAAINRASDATSKLQFFDWFKKTTLRKSFPLANKNTLSSQAFWNNMKIMDSETIISIEDEITQNIVKTYNIPTDCLLFDNTNFYTYVSTDNKAKIPKRGNSKEKRKDLKIVGLSLMISPFHNVPLLHATYPGNTNDAKQFATIVESLKDRYRKLNPANSDVTLVFDKGNNSQENIEKLALEEPGRFHFVGSLRLNQCPELLTTPLGKYEFLKGEEFDKAKAFRTTKEVYGKNFTVIITDNPSLYSAQLRGVTKNIEKCNDKLKELTTKIILRNKGEVTKGRNYTVASVEKNVKDIISVEHMNKLYNYEISEDKNKQIILSWSFNETNFKQLKKQSLGKTILFTDRDEWATERIVSAYRAQYHVEDNFRQLKDTKVLSFRPIRHYTDHNIRVHAFYCVLALTLCCLMKLELEQLGHKMSIHKMIRDFINVTQSIVGFETKKKKIEKIAYPKEIPAHVSKYINHYQLKKYALKI